MKTHFLFKIPEAFCGILLAFFLQAVPVDVVAQNFVQDGIWYTVNSKSYYRVYGYTADVPADVVIPGEVNGYPINGMSPHALDYGYSDLEYRPTDGIGADAIRSIKFEETEGQFILNASSIAHWTHLTHIELPSTTQWMFSTSFTSLPALKSILLPAATPPNIDNIGPAELPDGVVLYVPDRSLESYRSLQLDETDGRYVFYSQYTILPISQYTEVPVDPEPPVEEKCLLLRLAGGNVAMKSVNTGDELEIETDDGWAIHSVVFDEEHYSLEDNIFVVPRFSGRKVLNITFIQSPGNVSDPVSDALRVYPRQGSLVIDNYDGSPLYIYDTSGRLVFSGCQIPALTPGTYILTIHNTSYKFTL